MRRKKRAFSLLEIMVVIFLITLITGAIGYNMKGTLDKGRAFRTEQASHQLHDLLLICLEEGVEPDALIQQPADHLKKFDLAKNSDKLVLDGWGEKFVIHFLKNKKDFIIKSQAYDRYKKKLNQPVAEEEMDE